MRLSKLDKEAFDRGSITNTLKVGNTIDGLNNRVEFYNKQIRDFTDSPSYKSGQLSNADIDFFIQQARISIREKPDQNPSKIIDPR